MVQFILLYHIYWHLAIKKTSISWWFKKDLLWLRRRISAQRAGRRRAVNFRILSNHHLRSLLAWTHDNPFSFRAYTYKKQTLLDDSSKVCFGWGNGTWTHDLLVPKALWKVFYLLSKCFQVFLVQKQCFPMLLFSLFPGSPNG